MLDLNKVIERNYSFIYNSLKHYMDFFEAKKDVQHTLHIELLWHIMTYIKMLYIHKLNGEFRKVQIGEIKKALLYSSINMDGKIINHACKCVYDKFLEYEKTMKEKSDTYGK